ncbi:MAG TPA: fibrobacter succinogenes major paralogous domain-containing protein, partial [Tenuifilaceae bacterium]|nr:fibrobacter succinogenes major paralogous domain-containing protein [Tenuifilaceae bacterium]
RNGLFLGYKAGMNNTEGNFNVFMGNYSGYENTTGYSNVFIGDSTGKSNTIGVENVFIGTEAGVSNLDGRNNIFLGSAAGYSNTTGLRNIFLGTDAGFSNTEGNLNTFIGVVAGAHNTLGIRNIFIGQGSGWANSEGNYNVYIGDRSGLSNNIGEANVFIGRSAGEKKSSGSSNVFLGEMAGYNNKNGDGNVFIGRKAGYSEIGSNKLFISNSETESPLIYGEFDNAKVEVNGSIKVNEILNLKPQQVAPGNPEVGDIFYDESSNSIKFFNGSEWMELNATPSASTPFVQTLDVPEQDLASDSCVVVYFISDEGSSSITQSGVIFSEYPFSDPAAGTQVNYSTTENGEISIMIYGLTELTTYYVRSFATNAQGTALGNMISFTTIANPLPKVNTGPVLNITQTTATANGDVYEEGAAEVTVRGVCWSTNPEPTISDNVIESGGGLGEFTAEIEGLAAETSYFVRAFATNSVGTAYGNEVSFKTAPAVTTVMDIDNNTYNLVQIGNQTWFKENLKTTKYSDGTAIPNVTDDAEWIAETEGAFCWYNNDEASYKATYGALYNYYAVVDAKNICPTGWHVPTYSDWLILTSYLGEDDPVGGKMKEEGTSHWLDPNTGADNSSGFTGLPGGSRDDGYNFIGEEGNWWLMDGIVFSLYYDSNNIYGYFENEYMGLSVRCVKD